MPRLGETNAAGTAVRSRPTGLADAGLPVIAEVGSEGDRGAVIPQALDKFAPQRVDLGMEGSPLDRDRLFLGGQLGEQRRQLTSVRLLWIREGVHGSMFVAACAGGKVLWTKRLCHNQRGAPSTANVGCRS